MIFKIAKNELRNLFYSPVAWFIILIFFVQCALFYYKALLPLANSFEIYARNNPVNADRLGLSATLTLLLGKDSLLTNIINNLYLYIPLLTMGLVNREINNGSIKLLLSSPVNYRQIVFGKYVGIMLFNLLLLAIIGVFMISTAIHVRHVDYGILFSCMLGFYLLLGTYSAIGLYMSSITNYQIVAAISTFTILFCLSKIGNIWQEYDFLRDLTWFLSIQNRVGNMLTGLLKSRDVLYYLVIIYLFISFTLIRLRADKEAKSWVVQFRRYTLVVLIGLSVGYVGSFRKYTLYWDTTHIQMHTLPEKVQHLLESFEKDSTLEITFYTNLLGFDYRFGAPVNRNKMIETVWDPWLRFKPDIKFKYEYYYDYNPVMDFHTGKRTDSSLYKQQPGQTLEQIAYRKAVVNHTDLANFKSPAEMREKIDLDQEGYRFVMVFRYKGRQEVVRTYNDPYRYPDHRNIAAALKRLQYEHNPKIGFITGHMERNIHKPGEREYRAHSSAKDNRGSLVNIGFEVDTINLLHQDIANDISALVLADPKIALDSIEVEKLRDYISDGGNLMLLTVPGKQELLHPIMQELGLRLLPGQLAAHHRHERSDVISGTFTPDAVQLAPESKLFEGYVRDIKENKPHAHLEEFGGKGVVAIDVLDSSKFDIGVIAYSDHNSAWLRIKPLVVDSAKAIFTPSEGDSAGIFPIGMMLSRKVNQKEQRIVVMNTMINENISRGFVEVYSWLHYNEFPLYVSPIYPIDQIRIGKIGAETWKVIFVYILPCCILTMSSILLIKRKRK